MQGTVVMFARKSAPRPAFRPARRTPRRLLAELRNEITVMRSVGFDYAMIGRALGISQEDTRALSSKTEQQHEQRLRRHAIEALLRGRYAYLGGKPTATRARNLLTIACAYSFDELLQEPGVGTVTAMEIQLWLEERGLSLQPSN
jgi:hypothetical protein